MRIDQLFNQRMTRRGFFGAAAATGAGVMAGTALSSVAKLGPMPSPVSAQGQGGPFNWLTWHDHYLEDQLTQASSSYGLRGNPTLFSDNSEALLKIQQVGGEQVDMVSGDAYWVPRYLEEGLIEPFDLWALDSARGLYDVAMEIPFWKTPEGLSMAFPFGWSPVMIAYNPKYVSGEPDSWDVLWDPKYKGKITMELQPFDVMAMMAKSLNYAKPFEMTVDELSQAKDRLKALIPNILKFTEQNVEVVSLLADETVWVAPQYLGIEDRVKDAGGPAIKSFVPKEGTIGYLDGEMIVKGAANKDSALMWLDKMETGEWLAKNFLEYGRPTLSREAYHWLVKNGYEERAKRYLFDRPEVALSMTLKGPAGNLEATIAAFNEAIA